MSRKARVPIVLPKGVTVALQGRDLTVKGPKGTLKRSLREEIEVNPSATEIRVALAPGRVEKNFLGLYWALIRNMVVGVSQGFEKKLEMVGVGFRATVMGKELDLQIGRSHPVRMPIPSDIQVTVDKNTLIIIAGADAQSVGQFAASVRDQYKPEPYKGKGIRRLGEAVRKKAGKAGKAGKAA